MEKLDPRSEEVEDLLNARVQWYLKYGNVILLLLFIIVIVSSRYFSFPQTVELIVVGSPAHDHPAEFEFVSRARPEILSRINVNHPADIFINRKPSGTGTSLPATVASVDSKHDPIDGTVSITLRVADLNLVHQLTSGVTGKAVIVLADQTLFDRLFDVLLSKVSF